MEITVSNIEHVNGTLVLPINKGDEHITDDRLGGVARSLRNQIELIVSSGDATGKKGEVITLHAADGKAAIIGMGKESERNEKTCRDAGAKFVGQYKKRHGVEFTIRFFGWSEAEMAAFAEGMILRDYKYDKYKSKGEDGEEDVSLKAILQCEESSVKALGKLVSTAAAVATGVHLARDLGNCPPNVLFPMAYAHNAVEWAKGKENVQVNIISFEEAKELGMGGLVGVGMGSDRKPCMVIFELNRTVAGPAPVIVGKGITFDTGGISIKPSPSMDEMKYDMHGSATVFGLIQALHATNHEGRVTIIACMAENMPDAGAQRPGDVITTYSGKTVEVLNTDAEGRLVLADGLWKAADYDPSYIIDLATLTGACVVALGHEASGLWSNNDDLLNNIKEAGEAVDEIAWPMPLFPAFEKEMKDSKIADLRNLGAGRWGGSNTAAAFLKQFVPSKGEGEDKEQIPWAHMDIAGTAWGAKSNACVAHGATGIHVRTLHRLITKQ